MYSVLEHPKNCWKKVNLQLRLGKKNHEILAALQYKPLYNISNSKNGVKRIQATAYNGARTVNIIMLPHEIMPIQLTTVPKVRPH